MTGDGSVMGAVDGVLGDRLISDGVRFLGSTGVRDPVIIRVPFGVLMPEFGVLIPEERPSG